MVEEQGVGMTGMNIDRGKRRGGRGEGMWLGMGKASYYVYEEEAAGGGGRPECKQTKGSKKKSKIPVRKYVCMYCTCMYYTFFSSLPYVERTKVQGGKKRV